MRIENQTKTRVWEDSSLCPETSTKMPFKNSISAHSGSATLTRKAYPDEGWCFRRSSGPCAHCSASWCSHLCPHLAATCIERDNEYKKTKYCSLFKGASHERYLFFNTEPFLSVFFCVAAESCQNVILPCSWKLLKQSVCFLFRND
jgi:hypothetical protein